MSESTITLYRLENAGHAGPYHSGDSIESNGVIDFDHTPPFDMELSDAAEAAVLTGDYMYFFSSFEELSRVFKLRVGSKFHVKQVEVPTSLELDKYFKLQGYQVILDSDLYLTYAEQGKVVVRDDLTDEITIKKWYPAG